MTQLPLDSGEWKRREKDYVVIFTQKREGMCPSAFDVTFKSDDVSFNLSDNINLHQ